ncbi:MAG: hypothetical protein COB42_03095 [Sulfurimonas sp.]|nr:MAG: hypothetical protein COB42_03095 [Sulfurimonas sp.]
MGKQYKVLKDKDKEFIKNQKLFYIASCSVNDVNLSPKGYKSIHILSNDSLVFLDYPSSGNRTYSDYLNDGKFTLLFNAFSGKAKILRVFCKASVVDRKSEEFHRYLEIFNEKESLVRNFFIFKIYGVESSCGDGIPYMEYKGERNALKQWIVKLDSNNKLEAYKEAHAIPPNMQDI